MEPKLTACWELHLAYFFCSFGYKSTPTENNPQATEIVWLQLSIIFYISTLLFRLDIFSALAKK